jgi:hypothetical protein
VIFSTITLIEGFQTFTGEVSTFIAEPDQTVTKQFAVFFHEDAILSARQATLTVHPFKAMLIKVVFHRQVVDA